MYCNDQDYHACSTHDQLPNFSTIGRGPRGEGVTVQLRTDRPDEVTFDFISTTTGEVIMTTPNLSSGKITFSVVGDDLVIRTNRGGTVTEQRVPMPKSSRGSRFVTALYDPFSHTDSSYTFDVEDINTRGEELAVGDTIIFLFNNELCMGVCDFIIDYNATFYKVGAFDIGNVNIKDYGDQIQEIKNKIVSLVNELNNTNDDIQSINNTLNNGENGKVLTSVNGRPTWGVAGITGGGTGATTAAAARINLGAAAKVHQHEAGDITSGILPIERGGTGSNSVDGARFTLGFVKSNSNIEYSWVEKSSNAPIVIGTKPGSGWNGAVALVACNTPGKGSSYNYLSLWSMGDSSDIWRIYTADSIEAAGTSGNWYWRKWASGKAEAFARFAVTDKTWLDSTHRWTEGLYWTHQLASQAYPFDLVNSETDADRPIEICTVRNSHQRLATTCINVPHKSNGAWHTGSYAGLAVWTDSQNYSVTYDVHILGRWK